jgi:hypothetical protein
MFYLFLCVSVSSIFSTQAFADIQSYCEVFGQDFANEKTSDVDQWQINYRNAFGDCMAKYTADSKVVTAARKGVRKTDQKVVVVPTKDFSRKRRVPILAPGSIAWNKYCAAKYASFNKVTGNYKSHVAKERLCRVTAD